LAKVSAKYNKNIVLKMFYYSKVVKFKVRKSVNYLKAKQTNNPIKNDINSNNNYTYLKFTWRTSQTHSQRPFTDKLQKVKHIELNVTLF